jgi:hypothetical protein
MKHVKYIILSVLLLLCAFAVCGCRSLYPVKVTVAGDDLSDKKIDLLVKLRSRTYYYDKNDFTVSSQPFIKIDSDSEISDYDVDGYRSSIFHYIVEDYETERTADGKVIAKLLLENKNEFVQFCENCESAKVAVIDNNGKILQISDAFDICPENKVFIDNIEYDYSSNTVEPLYIYERDFDLLFLEAVCFICMNIMPLTSIVILLIFMSKRKKGVLTFPSLPRDLIFLIPCLPGVGYLFFRIDYALKTQKTVFSAWHDYVSLQGVALTVYHFVPLAIFVILLIWCCIDNTKKEQQDTSQTV